MSVTFKSCFFRRFWASATSFASRFTMFLFHRPRSSTKPTPNSFAATSATLHRVHNFNAGPSALPLSVLERIREELLDWRGSGMSVMEMSHRSPEFESINAAAEGGLRKHLAVPDDYAVIFLQGGGSTQ